MPAKTQFKKSTLSQSVQRTWITHDINKWLYASVFFSVFSSPQLYAAETPLQSNQNLEAPTSAQAIENNKEKLERTAKQQGLPKEKIESLDKKLDISKIESDIDSLEMLNQQEQSVDDMYFKQIDLDKLENLPVETVDPSLANEILQVAEDAKLEAQNFRANPQSTVETEVKTITSQDAETTELTRSPIDIDQLMESIQQDRQFEVSENEDGRSLTVQTEPEENKEPEKVNIFKRLYYKIRPPQLSQATQVPRISADVSGAPKALADNIKAKLSAFTVESFSDFNSAVPQLRNLSNQAAQAVGYYDAEFSFEKASNERVRVTVVPNEPVKVREQNVEFSGPGKNLAQLQVIRVLPDLEVGDIFHQGKYEATKNRISEAGANNGFFDSYWRMHDVKLARPQNLADINLIYETGERYKLDNVEFRMSDPNKKLPIREDLLRTLVPWSEGADFTAWRVNLLANNLTNSRYFNYTLVDAVKPDPIIKPLELAPDLQALVDAQAIDARLLTEPVEQKKPVAENDETDTEQTIADEKQFAGVSENRAAMLSSTAETEAEKKEKENERLQAKAREEKKIPVIVTLNADKLNSLEAGIGYGTDTGVRLRSQYRRSIVNQHGHSFDANLELSQIRQSIDGRYNIPYKHPLNDYISFVGGYEREDRDEIGNGLNLVVESGVAGVDRIIKGSRAEWQHIIGLRYRLDRMTIEGEIPDTLDPDTDWESIPDFVSATGNSQQESLLFGYEATKVTSDNRLNPTRGFKQNYKVQLGTENLLTDANLAIINANWKFLYSLGDNNNHQFIGGANLGYIVTEDFQKVPYNLRFFEGGDQSLRGFDYKSLSPVEFGYKVGGQARAIGTLEYNYQFKEGWRAALFSDFGNAYDEKFTNPTEYSIGAGIRWNSPIGPIRLDVASGISDPGKPIRLHFFIGPQL
jgi:translocation and assembly module TamA